MIIIVIIILWSTRPSSGFFAIILPRKLHKTREACIVWLGEALLVIYCSVGQHEIITWFCVLQEGRTTVGREDASQKQDIGKIFLWHNIFSTPTVPNSLSPRYMSINMVCNSVSMHSASLLSMVYNCVFLHFSDQRSRHEQGTLFYWEHDRQCSVKPSLFALHHQRK